MNLVTNASDAIGDNPGVITLRTGKTFCDECFFREVYLGSELPTGAYVYLAVSDTGCGMAAETQAKIFEPFFTTKFTGRGLGLASVLGIVRGHHGTIKIESQPGHGTTFTILFPCPDQATEAFAGDADTAEEWHGSGVILVVDDERTIRDLSRRVLEHAGFTVLTAADGSEAVRCFREHGNEISAILLDMTMPGLNGEETLQELRCLPHGEQARVILSSGFSEGEAGERFVGKGLAGFLHKPYTAKELIAKVQMALEDFEY
jgi:CheY-like chemotaxis protein